jgi:regulatory protein
MLVLRKLAAAPRTRHQLHEHLVDRGIPEEVAARVLDRFAELGYVDDVTYARDWVQSRHRSRALARTVIRRELRDRGIAPEIAEQALTQISQEAELQRAREFAGRKATRMVGVEASTAMRRLSDALIRKGYHWSVALTAAQEALEELSPDSAGGSMDEEAFHRGRYVIDHSQGG